MLEERGDFDSSNECNVEKMAAGRLGRVEEFQVLMSTLITSSHCPAVNSMRGADA